ncbi:MAG TPA: hypothetical protein VFX77_04485 [Rubrobacter sp.]|nr:hypothetical protein [Rubrobacter sp.]HYQ85561.1 hypothetical protein [Rubrobacter sp.]
MGRLRRLVRPREDGAVVSVVQKVGEFARKELTLALPAAQRAAGHAAQAFIKKFSEEYTKERGKR